MSSRPNPPARADRIMIVDDEALNLRLLTTLLQRDGYTDIQVVSDATSVVPLFESYQPDVVLLDLHMPGTSGFAVLEQIRARIAPDDYLPVLVLTGDVTPESKFRALSSGATDFLPKPFDGVEVVLRIQNLLQTRFLHRALRNQNQALEARVAERTLELESALRRAEAAQEAKEQFLAKMSHELRTPLNAIIGALELLRLRAPDMLDQQIGRMVEMASRNVEHMVGLINEILYLQSIEQGALRLDLYPMHLGAVVGAVAERAESRLRARGLSLTVEVPRDLARIPVDETRLSDVLWRLLDNAIRFTPEGGIEIRVEADPETRQPLRIDLTDSGVGIEQHRLEAIFEIFEQADNSSTRHYEGAGIGLSLCRALCRLMGYRLIARSEPGCGSTFSILLSSAGPETSADGHPAE